MIVNRTDFFDFKKVESFWSLEFIFYFSSTCLVQWYYKYLYCFGAFRQIILINVTMKYSSRSFRWPILNSLLIFYLSTCYVRNYDYSGKSACLKEIILAYFKYGWDRKYRRSDLYFMTDNSSVRWSNRMYRYRLFLFLVHAL